VQNESIPVALARESLEYYLAKGELLSAAAVDDAVLTPPAGVFVSLKKQGRLRGCIGTIQPTQATTAKEIIQNAVNAATSDPRFSPVKRDEIDGLTIWVDILGQPERIDSVEELNPKDYGVIVRCGRRSGLLLPDLEGVDSVEEQVAIARQKAGIGQDEKIELYRFIVTRYK